MSDNTPYKSIWQWMKEVSFTQEYIDVDGVRTRVVTAGDPSKPAVTLLHGTGGHWEAWAPTIPALVEDYFVMAPDYLGCGFTDKPTDQNWDTFRLVEHVRGINEHYGVEKTSLMGLSLGSWISVRHALMYPERTEKLVLMSPQAVRMRVENMERMHRVRTQAVTEANWDTMKEMFLHLIAEEENRIPDIIATRLAVYQREDTRNSISNMLYLQTPEVQQANNLSEEEWRSIQAPTLVVVAKKDLELAGAESDAKQIVEWVPNAEGFEMPNVAHWPNFEEPEIFNPKMLDFLAK